MKFQKIAKTYQVERVGDRTLSKTSYMRKGLELPEPLRTAKLENSRQFLI